MTLINRLEVTLNNCLDNDIQRIHHPKCNNNVFIFRKYIYSFFCFR